MTQSNELSMSDRPEWPLNAVPKHWIEALFAKMSAFYGSRFATMWAGSKADEVQKAWGIELGKLSRQQLKAGVEALTAFSKPPTLPEFMQHCRQMRAEQAASTAPRLENLPKATPEEAARNLHTIRTYASSLRPEPTAQWAFELIERGTSRSGFPLTYEVRRCATDAITSSAGRRVVESCADPERKERLAQMRQHIIDDYRARGIRLWEVR